MRSYIRRPDFRLDPAAPEEVREVLWRHKATLASYVCRPDAEHGHNAWLYLCENQGYRLEDLIPPLGGISARPCGPSDSGSSTPQSSSNSG